MQYFITEVNIFYDLVFGDNSLMAIKVFMNFVNTVYGYILNAESVLLFR